MLELFAGDFRLVEALQARDYNVIAIGNYLNEDFFQFQRAIVPAPHAEFSPFSKRSNLSTMLDRPGLAYRSGVPGRCGQAKKGWKQSVSQWLGRFINLKWRDDYFRKSGSRLGSSNPYLGETEEGFSLLAAEAMIKNQVKAIANL